MMKKLKTILFIFVIMSALRPANAEQTYIIKKLIGKGKNYQTPYYVFESGKTGHVVLLEGGIHGDELAGTEALLDILHRIRVNTGKLIIFPEMNKPACDQKKRFINIDINKIFPGKKDAKPYEYPLANEIFKMVGREMVEYVVTTHESKHLHQLKNSNSFGQTIIYGVKPIPSYAKYWIKTLNEKLTKKEKFTLHYYPIPTSSTEIFVETYKLKGGFCVETWRKFNWNRRVEMHKYVLLTFLDAIGFDYTLANQEK
jgi:hypothetical protein